MAIKAQRIMRSRRKGIPLPEGAVYVGRPTLWSNPFTDRRWGHARSTILHKSSLKGVIGDLTLEGMGFCPAEIEALHRKRHRILDRIHTLSGHDLACYCPLSSQWCHADTYLVMAAASQVSQRHAV